MRSADRCFTILAIAIAASVAFAGCAGIGDTFGLSSATPDQAMSSANVVDAKSASNWDEAH